MTRPTHSSRTASITILSAVLMVALMAMLAFAIDLGYLALVRTQLQAAADAGALAGAGALHRPIESLVLTKYVPTLAVEAARKESQRFVQYNSAGSRRPESEKQLTVDLNIPNDPLGDIVLGRLVNSSNHQEPLLPDEVHPNSVRVCIPMTRKHANGSVATFFARVIGANFMETTATATATIKDYPRLLPIATSVVAWESLAQATRDQYSVMGNKIVESPDQIPELTIYPGAWSGDKLPPGNFGCLQIGPESGTAVMRSQIDQGPTQRDFDFHGGSVGEGMIIPGETGISADVETAFIGGSAEGGQYSGILGKVRFMPLYNMVEGTGQNARFSIARVVCVRVVAASVKAGNKSVVVQPVEERADLTAWVRLTR